MDLHPVQFILKKLQIIVFHIQSFKKLEDKHSSLQLRQKGPFLPFLKKWLEIMTNAVAMKPSAGEEGPFGPFLKATKNCD